MIHPDGGPLMKDIPLNDFAKDILDETLWLLKDDHYKSVQMSCRHLATKEYMEHFTGIPYFEETKAEGKTHGGFPEVIVAHSFGSNGLNFVPEAEDIADEVGVRITDFYTKIQTQLNLKKNALFTVYPPEHGYISWHNNANASAYNFIFTYSETGEGFWRHYDPVKKEMVKIPDVVGWQCKAGFFGSYKDGMDNVLYHSARNHGKGLRMTIAFTLDRSELSSGFQNWIIDDIRED